MPFSLLRVVVQWCSSLNHHFFPHLTWKESDLSSCLTCSSERLAKSSLNCLNSETVFTASLIKAQDFMSCFVVIRWRTMLWNVPSGDLGSCILQGLLFLFWIRMLGNQGIQQLHCNILLHLWQPIFHPGRGKILLEGIQEKYTFVHFGVGGFFFLAFFFGCCLFLKPSQTFRYLQIEGGKSTLATQICSNIVYS